MYLTELWSADKLLKFELWTLNNFRGTVAFHFSLTGLAEQVCQARQSPDQCFGWDKFADPSLVGRKHAHRQHRFVPTQTLGSKHKRELRRSGNKQTEIVVATHSWWALLAIRSRVIKYWLAFVAASLPSSTGVPQMPMDTNPQDKSEDFQVMFLVPKNASEPISKHEIFKNFTPLAYLILYTCTLTSICTSQTNAICSHVFRGIHTIKFSAASRSNTCFLLIPPPPLKVFRRPCHTKICSSCTTMSNYKPHLFSLMLNGCVQLG